MTLLPAAKADSPSLNQALDHLYLEVKARFDQNPNFKNSANPIFKLPENSAGELPPDFHMPDPSVFKDALKAYCKLLQAKEGSLVLNKRLFGFMDYSQSAISRRFYVYDVQSKAIIHNTWGTHAAMSTGTRIYGLDLVGIPHPNERVVDLEDVNTSHYFSNRSGSNLSSLGMAIAESNPYYSNAFQSSALRLLGVDGGLNSLLSDRGIVIHGMNYDSGMIMRNQMLRSSEGCLMFPQSDFFEGRLNVNVNNLIVKELVGSPILLYHARMTDPERNERDHQEELARYAFLETQVSERLSGFALKYGWSEETKARYQQVYLQRMKAELFDLIEETYSYFKTPSRFLGVNPDSEPACKDALGL